MSWWCGKTANFTSGDTSPNLAHKIDEGRKCKAAVYKADEHGSLYGRDTKDCEHLENLNVLYVMPL